MTSSEPCRSIGASRPARLHGGFSWKRVCAREGSAGARHARRPCAGPVRSCAQRPRAEADGVRTTVWTGNRPVVAVRGRASRAAFRRAAVCRMYSRSHPSRRSAQGRRLADGVAASEAASVLQIRQSVTRLCSKSYDPAQTHPCWKDMADRPESRRSQLRKLTACNAQELAAGQAWNSRVMAPRSPRHSDFTLSATRRIMNLARWRSPSSLSKISSSDSRMSFSARCSPS